MNKKYVKYIVAMIVSFFICHLTAAQIYPVVDGYLQAPDGYVIFLQCATVFPAVCMWVFLFLYFHSRSFKKIKKSISAIIEDCNELNKYIETLKDTSIISNRLQSGTAVYSQGNTKKQSYNNNKNDPNIFNCSSAVCDGARKEPFKYICKYFCIPISERSLNQFEQLLNNFESVEEGILSLTKMQKDAIKNVSRQIPWFVRVFCKEEISQKLGFEKINFSKVHFPKYVFQYTSPAEKTSRKCEVTMDIQNLTEFVSYLDQRIEFRNSVIGQRALMTKKLREYIKNRDNYTCKLCGNSVSNEPNLLLEIDHIVPVSRGGMTTEENLQTLCWRCNRSKGAK